MTAASHKSRLDRMARNAAREVTQALYLAGQEIELEAEHSITAGSISGKGHVASRPGEPPNRDTGTLDRNIETTIVAAAVPTVHVTSEAPYAAPLEFGTSRMEARPYMRPATAKKKGAATAHVARAARKLSGGG